MEVTVTQAVLLVVALVLLALLMVLYKKYADLKAKSANLEGSLELRFSEWKQEHEEKIRKDARERSRAVISGKVAEHLAPLLPEFIKQYNLKDARFLGMPIDFIVFDGLDRRDLQKIVFLEVKSGAANLTDREKMIERAIQEKKVEFAVLRVPANGESRPALSDPVTQHQPPLDSQTGVRFDPKLGQYVKI